MNIAHLRARLPMGTQGQLLHFEVSAATVAQFTQAGQYCILRHDDTEGYFAIARAPGPGLLPFYVQADAAIADAIFALPLGGQCSLSLPAGTGYALGAALADDTNTVFVLASGSGYAGVRGALQRLSQDGRVAQVYLGTRTPNTHFFSTELVNSPHTIHRVYSRDPEAVLKGYVQHQLRTDAPDLTQAWVVACGQPEMLTESHEICTALGLPPSHFLTNY